MTAPTPDATVADTYARGMADHVPRRLRRDPVGWLAGYWLEPPFFIGLATFAFLRSLSEGSPAVGLIVAAALLPWAVPSIASMTELDADQLRTGFRLRPRRVPRAAVVRSRLDDVPWARGSRVPGVVLDLVDGTVEPIPMSAQSRPRTRARWADAIDAWAATATSS